MWVEALSEGHCDCPVPRIAGQRFEDMQKAVVSYSSPGNEKIISEATEPQESYEWDE